MFIYGNFQIKLMEGNLVRLESRNWSIWEILIELLLLTGMQVGRISLLERIRVLLNYGMLEQAEKSSSITDTAPELGQVYFVL